MENTNKTYKTFSINPELEDSEELRVRWFFAFTAAGTIDAFKRVLKALKEDPDAQVIYKRISSRYLYITNRRPEEAPP